MENQEHKITLGVNELLGQFIGGGKSEVTGGRKVYFLG
jgi:hypothetical protein